MDIEWKCDGCGQAFITDAKHTGAELECPKSKKLLIVPMQVVPGPGKPSEPATIEQDDDKDRCERCGRGVLMSSRCPKCDKLFCDVCSGMTDPTDRPQNMGGWTSQTIGGGTPKCPFCDGTEHLKTEGHQVNFERISTRDDGNRYEHYTAPSKSDALAFLREHEVKEPQCYVVVETPEGGLGKDIIGIYNRDTQENLELGVRRPLPKLEKSEVRCARCGYHVLKATASIPDNPSIDLLKSSGLGFYCGPCETAWCAFCLSAGSSPAACGICGADMDVMDF